MFHGGEHISKCIKFISTYIMRSCYLSIIIIIFSKKFNCWWWLGVSGTLHISGRKQFLIRWNVYLAYDTDIPFLSFSPRVIRTKELFIYVHSCFIHKISNLKTTQMFTFYEWINKLGYSHTWRISLSNKYRCIQQY